MSLNSPYPRRRVYCAFSYRVAVWRQLAQSEAVPSRYLCYRRHCRAVHAPEVYLPSCYQWLYRHRPVVVKLDIPLIILTMHGHGEVDCQLVQPLTVQGAVYEQCVYKLPLLAPLVRVCAYDEVPPSISPNGAYPAHVFRLLTCHRTYPVVQGDVERYILPYRLFVSSLPSAVFPRLFLSLRQWLCQPARVSPLRHNSRNGHPFHASVRPCRQRAALVVQLLTLVCCQAESVVPHLALAEWHAESLWPLSPCAYPSQRHSLRVGI